MKNEGEDRCDVCGEPATGSWLNTDVLVCNNVVCEVTLWDIMENIVRYKKINTEDANE